MADDAPTFTSSFINKNNSTKKFVPKAVRRRPGAAQASQPPAEKAAAANVEKQSEQRQAAEKQQIASSQTRALQPTPDPTPVQSWTSNTSQSTEKAYHNEPHSSVPSVAPSVEVTTVATPQNSAPQSQSTLESTQAIVEQSKIAKPSPKRAATIQTDVGTGSSPKKRRIEPTRSAKSAPTVHPETLIPTPPSTAASSVAAGVEQTVPSHATTSPSVSEQLAPNTILPSAGASTTAPEPPAEVLTSADQTNTTAETPVVDQQVATDKATKPRLRAKPKPNPRRRKAATDVTTGNAEVTQTGTPATEENAQPGATEGDTPQPAKKARKPRADKCTKRHNAVDAVDAEYATQEGEDEAAAPKPPKQKRAPKKKAPATNAELEFDEGGEDELLSRRKRVKSETPEGAENMHIDPTTAFMGDIAVKSILTGKMSQRERAMRQINWEEVKERRREREREAAEAGYQTNDKMAAALEAMEREEQGFGGAAPQVRIVDGQIVVDQATTTFDRYAEADRGAHMLQTVEEDDLTNRVTTQSWVLANKKDPKDRIMTGRSKRWSKELTEQFYDALRMFGTNFQLIGSVFPGTGRHSIKSKFTREERENPERVRAALRGERTTDWDQYLEMSNQTADDFIDVGQFNSELKEEADAAQVEIDKAKEELEEARRQRRLAGVPETEDEEEEEGGKKKKKKERGQKKKKEEHAFADEEGVEVLGPDEGEYMMDDDYY